MDRSSRHGRCVSALAALRPTQALLAQDVDFTMVDDAGMTLLHHAAGSGCARA